MSKFKVGDRVRRVASGVVMDVSAVYPSYFCISNYEFATHRSYKDYELVEEGSATDITEVFVKDELDHLIAKANEGLRALKDVWTRLDEMETVGTDGRVVDPLCHFNLTNALGSIITGYYTGVFVLRRKPAPAKTFGLAKLAEWDVSIVENDIKIGCQEFKLDMLKTALKHSISDNQFATAYDSVRSFYSTRKGLLYNIHTIPWPEVDKLLAALEEYLKDKK